MDALCERLGYEFRRPELLAEALTTPALRMDAPDVADNQRLEFLGDAALGLLAAERLFAAFPDEPEGRLTVLRTHMVSSAALCAAAARLGLAAHLRRNRGAAELPSGAKTIADAVEAVIGAAYLVSPIDIVPDVIPLAGWIDDLMVATAVIRLARFDLERYRRWKCEVNQ